MNAERQIFNRLLKTIGENHSAIKKDTFSGFCALKGAHYAGDLFVFGRAPNGWNKLNIKAQVVKEKREATLSEIFGVRKNNNFDPMSWVSQDWGLNKSGKYNPARSAFWRIARQLVHELKIADVDSDQWSSFLAWSNLYKISPYEGGNPSSQLANIQLNDCIELLRYEMSEWAPKRALFLTGKDWFDALKVPIEVSNSKSHFGRYVELAGKLKSQKTGMEIKVVVAKHPQGKPEEPFIKEVLRAFES